MKIRTILFCLLPIFVLQPSAFPQGLLSPPGPPGPTMKALDQIASTGIPLNANHVTATDANYEFVISQAGNYFLTGNLNVGKANGIRINSEGVTLDLNGFEISRASDTGGHGIEIAAVGHRATIRNGSIKGFGWGIRTNFAAGATARGCGFRNVAVSNCTVVGIDAGVGAVLESCRAHDNIANVGGIRTGEGSTLSNCTVSNNTSLNLGAYAMYAGEGSTLTNCTASHNTAAYGIFASSGSTLTNCSAYKNTSAEPSSAGIAAIYSTVTHCTASLNTSTAGAATPTTGMGFFMGTGSTIQNCSASQNKGDGIKISGFTTARENNCDANGTDGDGAGIHSTSGANRIEANNVSRNDRGIAVDGASNVVVKNTARFNTLNYSLAPNNVFGAIVDRVSPVPTPAAVSGNSAVSSVGTTDPWANISY